MIPEQFATPRPLPGTFSQCVYCGIDLNYSNMTVDHVIPKSRGGGESGNLAPCCKPCNTLKGPLTAREFMAMRDEPEEMAAYKRTIEDELNLKGQARQRELMRPLPNPPPKPPPIRTTYAQRQAQEREEVHRARRMMRDGECVAELGYTCHCQVCDPKLHERRRAEQMRLEAAERFKREVAEREPIRIATKPAPRTIETLAQWEQAEREWDKEVRDA